MTFRCRSLLDLARLCSCCMSCGKESVGDVVASHSNRASDGKGMGIKASDAAIAFVCSYPCHHEIDQGKGPAEERQAMWEKAHRASMIWLIESGHLVVRPPGYISPPEPVKRKAKIKSGAKIANRPFAKAETPRKIPSRPFPKRAKP